jgi:hypothetical protein
MLLGVDTLTAGLYLSQKGKALRNEDLGGSGGIRVASPFLTSALYGGE